ncbi:MAG: PKD domain-containing protein [Saprospiraceae bacterium]|nr:PKD domain-containing protein [Saprospiraceae bacterium]MCB9326808.1 PKD domain-containing protein [Lewinellaceae bacterium]
MKLNFYARLFLTLTAFLTFSISGFGQTASIVEGCAPLEVQFSPPAGQASFFWNFQTGATSTLSSPINIFINPGTYVVEFKNTSGGPVIGTVTINVYPEPTITLVTDTTIGCRPLLVQFTAVTDLSPEIQILQYEWVFGDGNLGISASSVSHLYNTSGHFSPSLGLETNIESCNTTAIFPDLITVSSVDNVNFVTSPFPALACEPPLEVSFFNFTPGTEYMYEWNLGDGGTFSGLTPPAHTYTEEGIFEVSLTVTDTNQCSGVLTRVVAIGGPLADFIVPDTVCILDSVIVVNTSDPGLYSWNTDPSVHYFHRIMADEEGFVFSEAGYHDVSLTVTLPDSSCSSTITKTVYVDDPDPSFDSDPSYSCYVPLTVNYTPLSPDAIAWEWALPDGTVSSDQFATATLEYPDEDPFSEYGRKLYYAQLIVTNPSGCRDTLVAADTLFRPDALFMPDVINGCAPLTVQFSDSSSSHEAIMNWYYTFGDGESISLDNSGDVSHTFENPGTYEVQMSIINEAGCVDTSYVVTIEVGGPLDIDFEVDQAAICPGDTVHFTSLFDTDEIDAWHFETDDGRSFHCFGANDLDWPFTAAAGTYDVTLTVEYNGCYSSITKEDFILVKGPIAKIDYEIDCDHPYIVAFRDSSYEATSVVWEFGDGDGTSTPVTAHEYQTTGNYTVVLTAFNESSGCAASMDTALVCVRDLQAAFTTDKEKYCLGVPMILDASGSVDVDAHCGQGYDWFFEHSNRPITTDTTYLEIPSQVPEEETIIMVATDINGCRDTVRHTVDIFHTVADFSFDHTIVCAGGDNPTSFTDMSFGDTTLVSWQWTFGDGTTSSQQNPVHPFNNNPLFPDTSYIVTLLVDDVLGCEGLISYEINWYQPVSQISTFPETPNICVGDEVEFTASDFTAQGSNLNFAWNFGNMQQSTAQTATTTYTQSGFYQVILNYEEQSSGCSGTVNSFVNVQSYPDAGFTTSVDGQGIVCYPENIIFFDDSESEHPLAFFWDFGNGQTAIGANPAASFGKGTFTIQMIASTGNGCQDTAYQQITLVGPEGDFFMDNNTICLGESITFQLIDTVDVNSYTWNFGDGTQQSDADPVTHSYEVFPPGGQTVATLVLEGQNGACTYAVENPVFIKNPVASFLVNGGNELVFCEGEVNFNNTSSGANSFFWNLGNGQSSTALNPFMVYDPGAYDVVLVASDSQYGCMDTTSRHIVLGNIPDVFILEDTLCPGGTATLMINSPIENGVYIWSPASFFEDPFAEIQEVTLDQTTTFSVIVRDSTGCEGVDDGTISVIQPLPWMDIDTSMCPSMILDVPIPVNDGFHLYNWSPTAPPFAPEENAEFTLAISDLLNCESAEYLYSIAVFGDDEYRIPNVFSPNGDDFNDVFKVYYNEQFTDQIEILDFWVYNRWGEKVYHDNGSDAAWDGTYKGEPAQADMYIYKMEILLVCEGRKVTTFGEVTLLR